MFAVPGWSVSSTTLKTQVNASQAPAVPSHLTSNAEDPDAPRTSNKKRKRAGKTPASAVTPDSLGSLWETVIEGKPKKKSKDASAIQNEKRQKTAPEEESPALPVPEVDTVASNAASDEKPVIEKRKSLKDKKREKKAKLAASGEGSAEQASPSGPASTPTAIVAALPKPVAQLTPLQASMRQKLVSARFRHLNQTLYTTPSAHSLDLFQQNPEMFQEYHEGFRRQVEVWPENPVDGYIRDVNQRGKQRGPVRKGKGEKHVEADNKLAEVVPLPRTGGTCVIADLGCGDAGLSQGLEKDKKKMKLKVLSYDLQNPSPLVTKADIANLPLEDGSVDIAIFCLALMGTNWVDFIEEAFRILRWKGELWVAEIKSRFGRVAGKNKRVEHSVGNRKKPDKKTLKKMEDDADDADLLVAVDGHDDNNKATDVSAFVEVLSKRGFVLQNENAVDLSNKMFVKMHFVKGATPIKGKCVPVPKGMAEMGMDTWKKKPKAKFIDEEEGPVSSEAAVLKPCVYKLR